jgi:hypothetical protein
MTPDTNQATEAQTSNISQLSSDIKQYARQTALSIMTALSTLVPSATTTMTALGAGAVAATTMSCEKDGGVDPIEQVNPNAFTAKEVALFNLRPDGSVPSFTVDIGDPKDPYFMPKLFKMEMRLIDAKTGMYEITPIISKKPIEDVLKKAEQAEPEKDKHFAYLALVIKRSDGTTYSPTSTFGILNKDDNNPATDEPNLSQLPNDFTIDYLLKFSPLNTATMKKSYTINKSEELQLWIETRATGKQLATVKLPIKPVEQLAVVTSN